MTIMKRLLKKRLFIDAIMYMVIALADNFALKKKIFLVSEAQNLEA